MVARRTAHACVCCKRHNCFSPSVWPWIQTCCADCDESRPLRMPGVCARVSCLSFPFLLFLLSFLLLCLLFICLFICSFVHLFVLFECDRRRDKKQREPREKERRTEAGVCSKVFFGSGCQPNASLLHLLLSAVMAAAGSASGGNAVKRLGKVTGGEERRGSFSVVLILVLVLLSLRRSWRS